MRIPRSPAAISIAAVVVVAIVAVLVLSTRSVPEDSEEVGSEGESTTPSTDPPNIIVIMTDDQTLSQMSAMTQTAELIGDEGVTFSDAVANTPECCPSRATYLTGQYIHNHHVYDGSKENGGYIGFEPDEALPVWLDDAGYWTAQVGKYLNGYGTQGPPTVPPGWDHWWGLIDPWTYYYFNFQIYQDGETVEYEGEDNYQTDVLAEHVVDLIRDRASEPEPFFISFTPVAPHTGFNREGSFAWPWGAPRHAEEFTEPDPRDSPSLNEDDVSDKPDEIADNPQFRDRSMEAYEKWYRAGLRSLLAVDEGVADIVEALEEEGELDNTYLVFTSDNGFFYGEHRIIGKWFGYEEGYRVPLLIRGPGIPGGTVRDQTVGIVDLAPSILEWTGASPGHAIDGVPLQPIIDDETAGAGRYIAIEAGPPDGPHYRAVHNGQWTYTRHHTGEEELYDLTKDPFQLENLAGQAEVADVEADMVAAYETLVDCVGEECRVGIEGFPGVTSEGEGE